MLHVILEFSTIPGPILVEVLANPVLDIVEPIPDVKLPFDIVVLSLAVFAAPFELPLITLPVFVRHSSSALRLLIEYLPFVYRSIWTKKHLHIPIAQPALLFKHIPWHQLLLFFLSHIFERIRLLYLIYFLFTLFYIFSLVILAIK